MTVILVEQDPEILSTFCDRIALLHEGRIDLVAEPSAFYAERTVLEQSGASVSELARISWQTGCTYEGRPPLTLEEAKIAFAPAASSTHLVGSSPLRGPVGENGIISQYGPPQGGRPYESLAERETVVKAEHVRYQYDDGTMALKEVDLTLYRGEMLALLGPNGSGKTTFAKILAGIYRPGGGNVEVLGQNLASRQVRRYLPRSVGYVFQNPDHQLFCRKVKDEIEYGLKNLGITAARRREVVQATLEAVDLLDYADEDPLFLSKGQRQRLAVAATLAMGPDVLIVDEPTTGQDYRSVTAMMKLLCNLQQQGKTILIITHDMSLVAHYCQRVIAFRDGAPIFTGTPTELFDDQQILQKTGLCAPSSAVLSACMRDRYPDFPPLITVDQWVNAIQSCSAGRTR